jgi:predicted nucleic acid-binding Zn ribbon protein
MVILYRHLLPPMTSQAPVTHYECPNCRAQYRLVRVDADANAPDREITCRSCGAPLQGREGRYALKYFLVNRPRLQAQQSRRR